MKIAVAKLILVVFIAKVIYPLLNIVGHNRQFIDSPWWPYTDPL